MLFVIQLMKVLITGATGFIGTRLCALLSQAGHTLMALSRDPDRTRRTVPQLQDAFSWEPLSAQPPPQALSGVDAVVHLAGESIAGRWTTTKKQTIYNSRIIGTRHLIEGLAKLERSKQPKTLISASAVGYYGHRGEEILTEESLPGEGFIPTLCQDWEREAAKAQHIGVRVVQLRTGLVLGPNGGALQAMLPIFRLCLGGPVGSGRQWWPWVHRDDVVSVITHILEKSNATGPINVTAPQAVRQREFAETLGRVLRRPAFMPAPAFALKFFLGEFAGELLASQHIVSARIQEMGYRFRFAELAPALRDIFKL
jgi:uncharacterized protein (TIGR01777 family)